MRRLTGLVGAVAFFMVLTAVPVGAGNATGLQWGDGSAPFNPDLKLVDQTTGVDWDGVVKAVELDWDGGSGVLTLQRTTGTATTGNLCSEDWDANVEIATGVFIEDEIHVCNFNFGDTGWAGLSITWSVPATGEIIVAQTLLNDFHLAGDTAFDINFRQLAACQEIGHGFGLDHQNGPKKLTCMNRSWGAGDEDFTSPNQHDFDQLEKIYSGGGNGNGGGGGGGPGGGGGGPCPNPRNPNCLNARGDFGTLSRVIHVIPAAVPGS